MSFENSIQLYERARRVIPGGISSSMRAFQKPVPLFIDRGAGSHLYDVDGNEYIDYALAHGPLILGHCHPGIVAAVEKQIRRGSTFGCQQELEAAVAEKILGVLPWAEQIVFSNTGTEAVQAALRLARAATGRNLIVKFEGHYHGWADSVLIGHRHGRAIDGPSRAVELLGGEGQSPSVLQDILVVPWNDESILQRTFDEFGDEVAAVIAEPMQCNTASILPKAGFLQQLRKLTERHRSVLIFDEVITGFRLAPGGASECFGVNPDLAVFAKAVAGGYPLSAVAGIHSVFSSIRTRRVRHLGTFNGNPIALAAAAATLQVLFDPAEEVYPRMRRLGARLYEGLQALSTAELPILIQGLPTCFHILFTDQKRIGNYSDYLAYDMSRTQLWLESALLEGIFQMGDGRWYLSGAHTDDDISLTLGKAERSLKRLASHPAIWQMAAS